jgi:large subunit ribosomal protein L28
MFRLREDSAFVRTEFQTNDRGQPFRFSRRIVLSVLEQINFARRGIGEGQPVALRALAWPLYYGIPWGQRGLEQSREYSITRYVARGSVMAWMCEICGKKASRGNSVGIRGKAKYLGGVGTKITGITRREFKPNLQTVRATLPSGAHKTLRVCTQCIRSGSVRKAQKQAPFKLPVVTTPKVVSNAKTGPAAKTGAKK